MSTVKLDSFTIPEISDEDLQAANEKFPVYLFFHDEGQRTRHPYRHFICSRCGNEGDVESVRTVDPMEDVMSAYGEIRTWEHGQTVTCPVCRASGMAYNTRHLRSNAFINGGQYFVFFQPQEDGSVYLVAAYIYKDYISLKQEFCPGLPRLYPKIAYVYRLTEQSSEMIKASSWYHTAEPGDVIKDAYTSTGANIREPFIYCNCSYYRTEYYYMIGLYRMCDTFLKYSGADIWDRHHFKTVSYLCRYHDHRQIEMMTKAELDDIVYDLLRGNENKSVINWSGTDIGSIFGLDRGEFRQLCTERGGHNAVYALRAYVEHRKYEKKKMTVKESVEARALIGDVRLERSLLKLGVSLQRTINYINTQSKNYYRNNKSICTQEWRDYISMGRALGYDFSQEVVLFPKNLIEKHTQVSYQYTLVKESAKNEDLNRKAAELLAGRVKKFAYSDGQFAIVVPDDVCKIIAEGQALHHCVASYVDRHASGQTTILFMRKVTDIDVPLYTIEYRDGKVMQFYGDHDSVPKGEDVRTFVDTWEKWVKNGSKHSSDESKKGTRKKTNKKDKTEVITA